MFRRLGVPRGQQCELEVITGSFGPRSRFTVELARTDLVLEVPRRGGLAGKLLFELPSAIEVHAQDSGGQVQVGKVDSAGDFVVQGIAVGPVKLSFRAHGVVLHEIDGVVLSGAGVERPNSLAAVDLSALAYLMTVVLHDADGEALRQATTTVRDPVGAFRFAAPTNRLAELRLAVPYSVKRLVIASPRYRDLEFQPVAGRLELRLSKER